MNDRAIVLRCAVADPPAPPASPPIPSILTRYDNFYPMTRRKAREDCHMWAERLLSAARSWYHSTDFFYSYLHGTRFAAFRLAYMELIGMPKNAKVPQGDRPLWQGFLERRLTEEELTRLDEWKPKAAELFEGVHRLLETGYDLSLSYSSKTKLSTCTLKDVQHGRSTAGWALSSQDSDGAGALKMAVFKHLAILEQDWTSLLNLPAPKRRG